MESMFIICVIVLATCASVHGESTGVRGAIRESDIPEDHIESIRERFLSMAYEDAAAPEAEGGREEEEKKDMEKFDLKGTRWKAVEVRPIPMLGLKGDSLMKVSIESDSFSLEWDQGTSCNRYQGDAQDFGVAVFTKGLFIMTKGGCGAATDQQEILWKMDVKGLLFFYSVVVNEDGKVELVMYDNAKSPEGKRVVGKFLGRFVEDDVGKEEEI